MKLYIISFILSYIYYSSEAAVHSLDVLNHLGTRTPYRYKSNKNVSSINYPGCKTKKIWMMVRHGTRFPKSKDMQAMNTTMRDLKFDILQRHSLGKGKLTDDQLASLEEWISNLDNAKDSFLTLEGRDEMVLLAERMQKRFPSVIKKKYSNETFLFCHTATQRTQQSARYFTNGLFETNAKDVIFAPVTTVEPVLRFYKHCDKWLKQVKKNPATYEEFVAFGLSRTMNHTLESVSQRLGLNKVLSLDTVKKMYKTCGYETAWYKHFPSPWCAAFDKDTAQVMEYYLDLKHYWKDGYGHELTYRLACMAIKDMFQHFSNDQNPKAVFYFSHSGTLLKMISHLGLYKPEEHLRADPYLKERPWKTTDIDCFATNLAFVLLQCKSKDYILTLHQEHIIKLPMCDKELCPLDHLTKYFHKSIHDCDYTDMCSLKKDEL